MEHLFSLFEEKDLKSLLAGLIMLFAIHIIWSAYKEKLKHTDEQIKHLDKEINSLKTEISRHTHIMASYMEQTIAMNDKMIALNDRMDDWLKAILKKE